MQLSLNQIREDFKDVKYYYDNKRRFELFNSDVHKRLIEKVKVYDDAVSMAPAKLIDLYTYLYQFNKTQENFAEERGFSSPRYVTVLHNELLDFLQKKFSKSS